MTTVAIRSDVLVIALSGEFAERVVTDVGAFTEEGIRLGHRRVILDLSGASWTSLRALKWMVGERKKLQAIGGDLRLAGVSPYLMNLLELTGTRELFDVFPTADEALAGYQTKEAA